MIWFNGAFFAADKPVFKGQDRGVLLGDGIFETILSMGSQLCFFDAHMRRLRQAASFLDIRIDYENEAIARGASRVIAESLVEEGPVEEGPVEEDHVEESLRTGMSPADGMPSRVRGALRVSLTRGTGPRGLLPPKAEAQYPSLMISWAASPALPDAPPGLSAPPAAPPLRAIISSVTRNERNPTSGIKALGYLDNQLAKCEAEQKGAGEAIMLNSRGDVACSTIGNVFVITEGGVLVTPPLESGILPGITRNIILEIAASCGMSPCEAQLAPDSLFDNFVFITNSLIGLRRITFGRITALWHEDQARQSFALLCRAYGEKILAGAVGGVE